MGRRGLHEVVTYHELGLLNLLQHMCKSGLDVIPCDSLLHGGVANGSLTFLVKCDDTLQHTNLMDSKKEKSEKLYHDHVRYRLE